jgi:hypothetical protein
MIDRQAYDSYLRLFNARDYVGVLSWFAPEFEIRFGGYRLTTAAEVIRFYTFLHAHLNEQILVDRFLSDEHTVVLEARVQLTGTKAISAQAAKAAGFERLLTPPVGQTIEIAQFIHYHLEGGKFKRALCAIAD